MQPNHNCRPYALPIGSTRPTPEGESHVPTLGQILLHSVNYTDSRQHKRNGWTMQVCVLLTINGRGLLE